MLIEIFYLDPFSPTLSSKNDAPFPHLKLPVTLWKGAVISCNAAELNPLLTMLQYSQDLIQL